MGPVVWGLRSRPQAFPVETVILALLYWLGLIAALADNQTNGQAVWAGGNLIAQMALHTKTGAAKGGALVLRAMVIGHTTAAAVAVIHKAV